MSYEGQVANGGLGEDEVDLRAVILGIWAKRWIVLSATIASMGIFALYAFFIAKPVYESSALLLPTQSMNADQLGSTAALLGKKNLGSADVELYQSLLTSRTVIRGLLESRVINRSDTGKNAEEALFQVLKIDTGDPIAVDNALKTLSKSVFVGPKESGAGGILEVQVSAETPWLAQGICQSILQIGQDELREVKIKRAETILPRLKSAVLQSKNEWDSSAVKIAAYRNRNRSITLPDQMLELSKLQMEQQVQEQKYLLARKEYETQALEKLKAVPPMMILDPANLPSRKSKPKRSMFMLLGAFVGFAISTVSTIGINAFRPVNQMPKG